MSTAAVQPRFRPLVVDLVSLTKPRVTALVMATAAVGMGLAPGRITLAKALAMFGTTALLVGSANALNCWLERDTDVFMERTCRRPLPARRLEPRVAFVFATVLGLLSLPMLTIVINPMTGLLGALSLFSYVWLYTPMKYRSPHAMIVGAAPGALPPLMGWTAVTGTLGWGGFSLFLIVFVWQMPHVIGLSMYRRQEYEKAGIRVLPLVHGPRVAQWHAVAWAALMVPVALLPSAFGLGGALYLVLASLLSAAYLAATLLALVRRDESVDRWGRRVFFVSLLYLPLLLLALLLDKGI